MKSKWMLIEEEWCDEMPDVVTNEEYDGLQTNGCQDIYYLLLTHFTCLKKLERV